MASSVRYKAQSALKTCEDHVHEELDIYCKTCKKPICLECVTKGDHKHHQCEKLKKTAHHFRKMAQQQKLKYTSLMNSVVNGTDEVLSYLTSENDGNLSKNSSELENTRSVMHEMVDALINKEKKKCGDHHSKQKKKIDEKRQQFSTKAARLKLLLESLDTDQFSDFDMIELNDEINDTFGELQNLATVPYDFFDDMVYTKGKIKESQISTMVGNATLRERNPSSVEVLFSREYKCGDTAVNSICPMNDTDAWVHCRKTTVNKFVNKEGVQKQTLDMKCLVFNFDVSKNGTTYFCDDDSMTVNCMDKSEKVKTLFFTNPLRPTFITLTKSGDLLVSLVDEDTRTRESSSRRLVRRMTQSGDVLQEYEYDNDGKTPLFVFPLMTIEHKHGNISISHHYEKGTGYRGVVYGFTRDARVNYRYTGGDKGLNPLYICCDMMGNTLVSDILNNCVHLIDKDGVLAMYLLNEAPLKLAQHAIAMSCNKLWISEWNTGIVKVFDYRY